MFWASNDPGGYWWPPNYSSWTPTIFSFSFSVSLILAEFTIFGSFRVLNFRSCFEVLNDVFSASNGEENISLFQNQYSLFMDVFLEQIFLTMYHARQMKVVCQSYDPEKLMYQVTQWGPHFGVSPPRVRFLDVQGFHCFSILYRPLSLIVTQGSKACSRHISSQR